MTMLDAMANPPAAIRRLTVRVIVEVLLLQWRPVSRAHLRSVPHLLSDKRSLRTLNDLMEVLLLHLTQAERRSSRRWRSKMSAMGGASWLASTARVSSSGLHLSRDQLAFNNRNSDLNVSRHIAQGLCRFRVSRALCQFAATSGLRTQPVQRITLQRHPQIGRAIYAL